MNSTTYRAIPVVWIEDNDEMEHRAETGYRCMSSTCPCNALENLPKSVLADLKRLYERTRALDSEELDRYSAIVSELEQRCCLCDERRHTSITHHGRRRWYCERHYSDTRQRWSTSPHKKGERDE